MHLLCLLCQQNKNNARVVWTTNLGDFLLLCLVQAHISRAFGLRQSPHRFEKRTAGSRNYVFKTDMCICIDVYVHVYVKPVLPPPLWRTQMLHNASSREQRSRDMTKQQSVTYE